MKLFCRENHWGITKEGQLILNTKSGKDKKNAQKLIKVLEIEVRKRVYTEIASIDFVRNKKQIVKNGIINVALTVQDYCARTALNGPMTQPNDPNVTVKDDEASKVPTQPEGQSKTS